MLTAVLIAGIAFGLGCWFTANRAKARMQRSQAVARSLQRQIDQATKKGR